MLRKLLKHLLLARHYQDKGQLWLILMASDVYLLQYLLKRQKIMNYAICNVRNFKTKAWTWVDRKSTMYFIMIDNHDQSILLLLFWWNEHDDSILKREANTVTGM